MHAEPEESHAWLQQLVGEWQLMSTENGPEDWIETIRPVGDIWIVAEGQGTMPDGVPGTTLLTVGYDPERQSFVGTWIGSMMTHLWHYEGFLDEARRTLTLESEGPDMERPGQTARYRDIVELTGDGHRDFRAMVLDDDGTWREMMTATYRKVA
jgi:hypothetical protein